MPEIEAPCIQTDGAGEFLARLEVNLGPEPPGGMGDFYDEGEPVVFEEPDVDQIEATLRALPGVESVSFVSLDQLMPNAALQYPAHLPPRPAMEPSVFVVTFVDPPRWIDLHTSIGDPWQPSAEPYAGIVDLPGVMGVDAGALFCDAAG